MPVSSVPTGCCTYYTVAGKCTVDGNNNKEDNPREEADMTPSPVFPKYSKVAQNRYSSFGPLWILLEKNGLKVMSA